MINEPIFVVENRMGLEVFARKVRQLTAVQLTQPLEAGWTVSAVLGHLAFWDLRALDLIRAWEENGAGPSPMDTDIVNEAMRRLLLAIPPLAAVELAIDAASEVDREIANLSPDRIADIEKNGGAVHLNRATHRRLHLSQIEGALDLASD
jgi:hypothetical protein